MSGQSLSVAGPVVGAVFLAAAGVVLTFFPGAVQRWVGRPAVGSEGTLTHRAPGVFLLVLAVIMAYTRVAVYAVVATAVGGAAYAFWPRALRRLLDAHAHSRIYAWELRVIGVSSLAASAIILYLRMK